MVRICNGADGSGSGSSSIMVTEPIDEGLREFITSKITRGILDATLMMFWSSKEGIMELMDDFVSLELIWPLASLGPALSPLRISGDVGHHNFLG